MFISHVCVDEAHVDSLCKVLEAAQIPCWRDRKDLGPGAAWRAKIRQAIRDGSMVFLTCFSDSSRAKQESYMNEELTEAVDQFRKMRPGRTWLIPVRLDDGEVPEWDLGAGRSLSDLNYSDLFGDGHLANAARLVTTIHRLTGEKQPDAATAFAAVEQATSADRVDLLRRLTKEMLPDPLGEIELHDLVSHEVRRITDVLSDQSRVAGFSGSTEEQLLKLVLEADDLWQTPQPFITSLPVAARWGRPEAIDPWADGLRSIVKAANRQASCSSAMIELRQVPAVIAIMTVAMTWVAGGKWTTCARCWRTERSRIAIKRGPSSSCRCWLRMRQMCVPTAARTVGSGSDLTGPDGSHGVPPISGEIRCRSSLLTSMRKATGGSHGKPACSVGSCTEEVRQLRNSHLTSNA